ncbi:hypothetical protein J2W39_005918 [Variovorax paradoxus]|uniref:Uncharacterized protein n=1 Tax=Variovorax paradoxus TaxID=34073 RepID=A0AAW8EP58_VARPD|nr:hypothetical protein [Variovorax paradoxus]
MARKILMLSSPTQPRKETAHVRSLHQCRPAELDALAVLVRLGECFALARRPAHPPREITSASSPRRSHSPRS